ncbi:MAG: hypothetical protein ACLRPT_11795 [Akkermansia muciniphila]
MAQPQIREFVTARTSARRNIRAPVPALPGERPGGGRALFNESLLRHTPRDIQRMIAADETSETLVPENTVPPPLPLSSSAGRPSSAARPPMPRSLVPETG